MWIIFTLTLLATVAVLEPTSSPIALQSLSERHEGSVLLNRNTSQFVSSAISQHVPPGGYHVVFFSYYRQHWCKTIATPALSCVLVGPGTSVEIESNEISTDILQHTEFQISSSDSVRNFVINRQPIIYWNVVTKISRYAVCVVIIIVLVALVLSVFYMSKHEWRILCERMRLCKRCGYPITNEVCVCSECGSGVA
jgi:hypothetical protein